MIKAKNVVFEYQKYDEEGNVCETKRAVDGVELDVKKGEFIAILGHNGSGNPHWRSISMRFFCQATAKCGLQG